MSPLSPKPSVRVRVSLVDHGWGRVATSLPQQPEYRPHLPRSAVIPASPRLWGIKLPYECFSPLRGEASGSLLRGGAGLEEGMGLGGIPAPHGAGLGNKKPELHGEHPLLRPRGWRLPPLRGLWHAWLQVLPQPKFSAQASFTRGA